MADVDVWVVVDEHGAVVDGPRFGVSGRKALLRSYRFDQLRHEPDDSDGPGDWHDE